jgi:ankyrin repeat protein
VQHCVDCHNAELQMADLRLDQRQFVLADEGRDLVKPGHSADSLLVQRLVDPKLGILMPPTFPFLPGEKAGLSAAKINVLKAWIDQGANWPEEISLTADAKTAASDPQAAPLFAAIRAGDHGRVEKLLQKSKTLIAARDKHGATPLIQAALYGDAKMVELLLASGSDVHAASDEGATALHRAAGDLEKVRLLLKAGAKVDARTSLGRTPLLIAASFPGNAETVRLLLESGAKIADQDPYGETCLTSAAKRGDAELAKVVIEAGADLFAGTRPPLVWAAEEGNVETIAFLLEHGAGKSKELASGALGSAAARGPTEAVRLLLDHGADPNAKLPLAGYTPLMMACYSENVSAETVRLLLAKGGDVKVKGQNGETPLSLATKRGNTQIVEMLKKAGAEE